MYAAVDIAATPRPMYPADGRKLPWFGPPMSAASMASARLMETWAHGADVADTLGVREGSQVWLEPSAAGAPLVAS